MLRAGGIGGDERKVDVGLGGAGELHLGLLGSFLQALQSHLVAAQVDAVVLLELVGQPVDDALVPVVTTEVVVASGGANLEDAVTELEHGHVEGAAAEVEDEDLLVLVRLVEAVSQSGSRRLVDDAQDFEAGDLARVLRGLALCVVEVCRDGDDGLRDGLANLLLGVVLQLLQHDRGNFLGHVVLAVDVDDRAAVLARLHAIGNGLLLFAGLGVGTADEALDGAHGVLRVGDRLVLSGLADHALAILAEADNGRRGAVALGVNEDFRLGALHDRHGGIRGAKVDTDDLCHLLFPFSIRVPAVLITNRSVAGIRPFHVDSNI